MTGEEVFLTILRPVIGDSTEESRVAIKKGFWGIDNLTEAAKAWAKNHCISGREQDIFNCFVGAVDIGWRIRDAQGGKDEG